MTELGPKVRDADLLGYAETVAAETMSRSSAAAFAALSAATRSAAGPSRPISS
jgi:hypothetical protein